jgi:hypothetical protein
MSLVLDSSVALAWIYADETTDAVLRLFDDVRLHGAWVPGPFHGKHCQTPQRAIAKICVHGARA